MKGSASREFRAVEPSLAENPDRYFDPDPATRRAAHAIFEETERLPLICPHGHVDPALLANNSAFPEPSALLITPDHYIFRMLYSQGISLESLGIPSNDGNHSKTDPRAVWQLFADNYYLFRATPTGAWLDYELFHVFGIPDRLNGQNAQPVYDSIVERLKLPEYRPRALFDRFRIEVLATTDAATDSLDHHRAIQASDWNGIVIPTFRPDAIFAIASKKWTAHIAQLGATTGKAIATYKDFVRAVESRRTFFRELGATSTDHAVADPYTERLSDSGVAEIFERGLRGTATTADQVRFESHMLMESARMSVEDGMVMQLHPGAHRNHNERIRARFGTDKGADIPLRTEYTRNLSALLNAYGNEPGLTLVVFTLDESTYARELAPLAGHYPALRLGPPWWFHDSIEGMKRYRQSVTETAGIYNTAGFNDDTRAFCSIPARHDLSRRVDANWLGGLVARHVIDMSDAREMGRAVAYDLAKKTYKLEKLAGRKPQARKTGAAEGGPA